MSHIEELPADFYEALNLDTPSTSPLPPSAHGGAPKLDPGAEAPGTKTADEILDMMRKTPLFMTDLEGAEADENNEILEGLRALQYEGTKSEIAQGFRDRGNEMARAKMWGDGKEFYTKGILVLTDKNRKGGEGEGGKKVEDGDEEERKERKVEEACYVNRALCNLELKNYRATTLDCAATLQINPHNVKAYYRSALALLALDKILEAQDACSRGLEFEPWNTALKAAHSKISARHAVLESTTQKKKAEQDKANREKLTLVAALRARDIKMRATAKPLDLADAAIHLSPDPLSPESHLVFPVVLLYPMHAQSDFIKAFPETETLGEHLKYIFPLPWDDKGEYSVGGVECYMEGATSGLIKAGKKMSLLKILGGGKVEVVDGLVRVNVLPVKRARKWVEEMKGRKGEVKSCR